MCRVGRQTLHTHSLTADIVRVYKIHLLTFHFNFLIHPALTLTLTLRNPNLNAGESAEQQRHEYYYF